MGKILPPKIPTFKFHSGVRSDLFIINFDTAIFEQVIAVFLTTWIYNKNQSFRSSIITKMTKKSSSIRHVDLKCADSDLLLCVHQQYDSRLHTCK